MQKWRIPLGLAAAFVVVLALESAVIHLMTAGGENLVHTIMFRYGPFVTAAGMSLKEVLGGYLYYLLCRSLLIYINKNKE